MQRMIVGSLVIVCTALPILSQTPSKIRIQYDDPTPEKMTSIPTFVLPAIYKDRVAHPLPASVDNSKKPWMPPYGWTIQGWSCANATAVSFVYSYEVQRMKNMPTGAEQLPFFTYE